MSIGAFGPVYCFQFLCSPVLFLHCVVCCSAVLWFCLIRALLTLLGCFAQHHGRRAEARSTGRNLGSQANVSLPTKERTARVKSLRLLQPTGKRRNFLRSGRFPLKTGDTSKILFSDEGPSFRSLSAIFTQRKPMASRRQETNWAPLKRGTSRVCLFPVNLFFASLEKGFYTTGCLVIPNTVEKANHGTPLQTKTMKKGSNWIGQRKWAPVYSCIYIFIHLFMFFTYFGGLPEKS